MGLYERISVLLPKNILDFIETHLYYVGSNVDEKSFSGFTILLSLALAVLASGICNYFYSLNLFFVFPIAFVVFFIIILALLNNSADNLGHEIERLLPDALELLASNMKSGMTLERALAASARPELGLLGKELKSASKSIIAGEDVDTALNKISRRIKSDILKRTIWLLLQGMKSGGELSDLLIKISRDLKSDLLLKQEIKANVSIYFYLIFIAAALGLPFLLAISNHIVEVMNVQTAETSEYSTLLQGYTVQGPSMGIVFSGDIKGIDLSFLEIFSYILLACLSVLTSFTLGIILRGKEVSGIKYIPLLIAVSFVVFFLSRLLLKAAFSQLGITF